LGNRPRNEISQTPCLASNATVGSLVRAQTVDAGVENGVVPERNPDVHTRPPFLEVANPMLRLPVKYASHLERENNCRTERERERFNLGLMLAHRVGIRIGTDLQKGRACSRRRGERNGEHDRASEGAESANPRTGRTSLTLMQAPPLKVWKWITRNADRRRPRRRPGAQRD
jgi:hypothetical protein